MNTIKRITVICFAVLVLAANLPLCASAVDPVSAATMANAMAQAITAYGASQGVSMTFDVASTDGIGEGVHELWDQFVEDVNDPDTPTYDSLAVTMWSNLYSKIGDNLGVNISASEMPFIDSFWNWLLSGPAEMTKVNNQYYEWSLNQNNTVNPIQVYFVGHFPSVPLTDNLQDPPLNQQLYVGVNTSNYSVYFGKESQNVNVYLYCVPFNNYYDVYVLADSRSQSCTKRVYSGNSLRDRSSYTPDFEKSGCYIKNTGTVVSYRNIPLYQNSTDAVNDFLTYIADPYGDSLSVMPYIGDTAPQNVYIPDNTDVNYNPTDVAIPLDIPWDNTLFGDGSGILTDAQSEAAAAAADDAITDSLEKTLTLADTENPDIPAPNEVYIPLLPVELPNFNFSLSGIWHYVVSWVQSLGAWLSLMFQTWAVLPSAITIPVYATAVIVIVLGVYKRFFM